MFDLLDICRDFFGYLMIVVMAVWVKQRMAWIHSTTGSMRMDARAVQCVALCMIVSILFWQVGWHKVGAGPENVNFVLFAVVSRLWLVAASTMAVVSYWNLTQGNDWRRNVRRLVGLAGIASALSIVSYIFLRVAA